MASERDAKASGGPETALIAKPGTIIALGALATFGAFMGVLADVFSAWSSDSSAMATAFSVDLDSVQALYRTKPRWTYVTGNYLGVFFIPLHMLGFILVHQALKPASRRWALAFLALAFYSVAIGTGLHGTLAFVGDIVQAGDPNLVDAIRDYWQPWAYSLVAVYAVVSGILLVLIASGRSLYPRWTALLSPIVIIAVMGIVNAVLPVGAGALKSFLSVTGLNLPLMIFYLVTTCVLARREDVPARALDGPS